MVTHRKGNASIGHELCSWTLSSGQHGGSLPFWGHPRSFVNRRQGIVTRIERLEITLRAVASIHPIRASTCPTDVVLLKRIVDSPTGAAACSLASSSITLLL